MISHGLILFCFLYLFKSSDVLINTPTQSVPQETFKVDYYEQCVTELSENWQESLEDIETRVQKGEDLLEKASLSLCLGDYYSGLIDGPVGQLDLYKSFYNYIFASSQHNKHLQKAQYMIAFLLSLHPEVAPEPFSKSGSSVINVSTNQPLSLLYYQFAAQGGSKDAKLALAYRVSRGASTPESCPTSTEWYREITQQALVNENWKPTIELKSNYVYLSEEYEAGKNTLENEREIIYLYAYSADNGNVDSQVAMGTVFLEGLGGNEQSYDIAFKYYLIAAEEEEPQALLYLGYMYLHGYGCKQDNATAIKYFEEAVAAGVPEACTQLGIMYLNGWSVKQDLVEAVRFFDIAVKQNEPWALLELGRLYYTGKGVAKNFQTAHKYFQKSSQAGNLPALYNLAILTENGFGTVPSCPLAIQYLQKIVERTYLREINLKAYNKFVEGNYENALMLYEMTANQGSILGQENAAWMYENNLGSTAISQIKARPYAAAENDHTQLVLLSNEEIKLQQERIGNYSQEIQNEKKAFYFYQLAAAQLSSKAYLKLGDYLYYGKAGLEVNYISAAACYSMASNLKNGQAAFNLGTMHHLGIGLAKDLHLAKRNYDKAIEMTPEAYVPSILAIYLIQIEWALSPILSEDGLIWGMAWDTVLIAILTTLLAGAVVIRRYLS
jgi:TPR repeat protein